MWKEYYAQNKTKWEEDYLFPLKNIFGRANSEKMNYNEY